VSKRDFDIDEASEYHIRHAAYLGQLMHWSANGPCQCAWPKRAMGGGRHETGVRAMGHDKDGNQW
jgi:hypothetical protein